MACFRSVYGDKDNWVAPVNYLPTALKNGELCPLHVDFHDIRGQNLLALHKEIDTHDPYFQVSVF